MDAIGVFDSGVGGLTVVSALRRRLPGESILYLGDTARLPYGSKSPDTVTRYTRKNLEFLSGRGVKAVVVACNTASALALPNLEPHKIPGMADIPVWGVIEPGARKAAEVSRGRVGVIATEASVRSDAYPRALRALRPELDIRSQACPLFVPLVEEGWHDDPITAQVAERYLRPLLDAGIDTLVLGCTHYPLIKDVLQRIAGPDVVLVDYAEQVAAMVADGLAERHLEATHSPLHTFCVTDSGETFQRLARTILKDESVELEWVEVV